MSEVASERQKAVPDMYFVNKLDHVRLQYNAMIGAKRGEVIDW